jgi:1-aminocyclopropane-1-carboxylate deaminase
MIEIFSPIHAVAFQSLTSVDVKRDDLIDPYISGNKWRKLKHILNAAKKAQKKHLITFGGAYSNHLLATAALAARANLKSTAFVRGEIVSNEMLMLCKLFGMKLIFTDRTAYKDKNQLYETHFGSDNEAFFIDEGGACKEGIIGCSEIITELQEPYTHIFCAAGTGTTAAGLLKGINDQKLNTTLHVVPVLKGGEFIEKEINKYQTNLTQLKTHTNYHFGGYAKTTPELIEFIKKFTSETGILIDPVYTGKMFYAIYDLYHQNYFKKDDRILAIHTGGLFGILGMKEKFN